MKHASASLGTRTAVSNKYHRTGKFFVYGHRGQPPHYELELNTPTTSVTWLIQKTPSAPRARLAVRIRQHRARTAHEASDSATTTWDAGSYQHLIHEQESLQRALWNGFVEIELYGRRLRGRFTLQRINQKPRERWLFKKVTSVLSDNMTKKST